MKHHRLVLLAAVAIGLGAALPAAADVYVVANPALAVGADEIRDVWLGDKQIAGGTKVVPLDNAVQQKEFLERVLKLDAARYSAIWIKKGFRDGLNAPAVKNSDADVIAAVKANPGGIGYVSAPPRDLKVIARY
jgi:hypothetical protein